MKAPREEEGRIIAPGVERCQLDFTAVAVEKPSIRFYRNHGLDKTNLHQINDSASETRSVSSVIIFPLDEPKSTVHDFP